jgi:hypothetical protein
MPDSSYTALSVHLIRADAEDGGPDAQSEEYFALLRRLRRQRLARRRR